MRKTKQPLLKLKNIVVKFDELTAVHNVSLDVERGEIHAIVGEHGAGKSSLGLILSGFLRPYSGAIYYKGRTISNLTPESARENGIEIVTQYNPLFDQFTVANNVLVNNKTSLLPFFNSKHISHVAREFLRAMGFDLDPNAVLKNLNLSDRVLVDILKHIYPNPNLLILDEALEKLSTEKLEKMVAILRKMKAAGTTILFITHRIDDIYSLADRVTIIRDGHKILTDSVDNIDKINIIRLAYTQFLKSDDAANDDTVFYQLLKYNEAILEKLPINLVVIDEHGKVKMINETAKIFFQTSLSSNKITVQDILTDIPESIAAEIIRSIQSKENKAFYQVSMEMEKRQAIINIKLLPIFDENFFLGTILIIEDITEQEKLRDQIVLSENLSSIGLLAAGVAHEINNPLEIIYNDIQSLRFDIGNEKILNKINELEEEVQGISQIISNLITFSDNKKAYTEKFNLIELIDNLIGLIKYNARYKQISISFQKSEETIYLEANKTEIKQAVLNIMKNSFEAMPAGGNLRIQIEKQQSDGISEAVITFTDSGTGISEEKLQNIFLPFFSTKTGQQKNMGLGLSISYGIITKYKGTITVHNLNPPRHGCVFTIRLPVLQ